MKPSKGQKVRRVFWGAVALTAAIACGGRSNGPFVGGESHFLYRCVSSCSDGLSCISGVCTKPCIVSESNCSGLADGAFCTSDSGEPGAVAICDLACANDGDCATLGTEHGCNSGYCRAPADTPGSAGTGGSASQTGGTGAGSSGVAGQSCPATLVASPEQNYEYVGSMSVANTLVKPDSDLLFDWSGVTSDFRGRPVDLDTIDMVEISLWEETLDSFTQKLSHDLLANPIVIGHIPVADGVTSASILQLNVPAGPLDTPTVLNYLNATNYPPANHTYAAMVATGDMYGQGTYMLAAFQLDPQSANTTVSVTSTSTRLDYTATIAARAPTYVPPGTAAVSIDWTTMRITAAGDAFIPSSITALRIGSYTQTPEELEGAYFNHLDAIAVDLYEAEIDAGTKISLDQARTQDGRRFEGIDDTHTWLLALNCGACQAPAPWYLTVLKPCSTP